MKNHLLGFTVVTRGFIPRIFLGKIATLQHGKDFLLNNILIFLTLIKSEFSVQRLY